MSATGSMLAAACEYAERGWRVFPVWGVADGACRCPHGVRCHRAGKHPRTPHGFADATSDTARIDRWWRRHRYDNIGIWAGGSDLVVVDIDGREGAETYGRLLLEFGPPGSGRCTDGAAVITGRGGGMHLYFTAPDGAALKPAAPWRAGVDIRAGGGYAVAPPSVHVNGRRYRWLVPPPEGGPPPLAPSWVEAIAPATAPPPPVHAAAPRDGRHGTKYGRAALAGLLRDLAGAGVGARNHATYTACRRVLDLHAAGHLPDAGAALDLVAEVARETGLSAGEIDKTRASAFHGARETTYA